MRRYRDRRIDLLGLLGLAVIAAITLVALASPPPAAADTLCRVVESPCEEENEYPISTFFEGRTSESVLEAGSFSMYCASEAVAETTSNLGAGSGLTGEVLEVVFSNCEGSTCSAVKEAALPLDAFAEAIGGGDGTSAASEGGGGGIPQIEVECPIIPDCLYGAESVPGSVIGGSLASVEVEVELTRLSGSFCPTEATFLATYTAFNAEEPTYLMAEP